MPDQEASAAQRSAASPDSLTKTDSLALSESALATVSAGGATTTIQDVAMNKSKTADKEHAKLDAFIKQ